MALTPLLQDRRPHCRFQKIRDVFFILSGVLNIFFYNKKLSFSLAQLPCIHSAHSLQLISGPCSIEIMYPCKWRIAIPASLMRVDKRQEKTPFSSNYCIFFNDFFDLFRNISQKSEPPSRKKLDFQGKRVCVATKIWKCKFSAPEGAKNHHFISFGSLTFNPCDQVGC